MVRLIEVFKDFEIIVDGASNKSRYRYPMKVEKKKDAPTLKVEDLERYVDGLRARFPEKDFVLIKGNVEGKEYYVITKTPRHKSKDYVPIYFDLEEQRFFVPEYYLKDRPKLVNYIVMVTLGSLGISQTKRRA